MIRKRIEKGILIGMLTLAMLLTGVDSSVAGEGGNSAGLSAKTAGAETVSAMATVNQGNEVFFRSQAAGVAQVQKTDRNDTAKLQEKISVSDKKRATFVDIVEDSYDDSDAWIPYVTYYDYTTTSLTLVWYSMGQIDGFHIYRKCKYDSDYKLIGTVKNSYKDESGYYGDYKYFKDTKFLQGITFNYRVVAYRLNEESNAEVELNASGKNAYTLAMPQVTVSSAKRSGNTKAVLKWKKASGVTGYEIYRKNSGSTYKRVKRIGSASTLQWTAGSVSTKKTTNFKIRAYVKYGSNYVYGSFSDAATIVTLAQQKIVNKFKSLQKKYPDGKYWNHRGKSKWNSSTITSKPCIHGYDLLSTTCNYYHCPNGVLGYQCYGFAWKMSDLVYGRNAKIKNFRSFSKCKMGDVIRYSGHSVIITEKHSDYVVVGECNYGNTCIIKWGRKVYRSELSGAVYSRRY